MRPAPFNSGHGLCLRGKRRAFTRRPGNRRFWCRGGCLLWRRGPARGFGDRSSRSASRGSLTARGYISAKVQTKHLPRPEVPGRANPIGVTQLAIVPTIPPGDAVEGFTRLDYMPTPINRGIVNVILVQCRRIAARQQHQSYEGSEEKQADRSFFSRATRFTGTGKEPRGHR